MGMVQRVTEGWKAAKSEGGMAKVLYGDEILEGAIVKDRERASNWEEYHSYDQHKISPNDCNTQI